MVKLLKAWCFKVVEKVVFLFFCFWFVLLFCRLLWRDLSELVLMMEHDCGCSMGTFTSYVNHGSAGGLVRRFQGSEGTRGKEIYMMFAKVKEGTFWRFGL